MTELLLTPFAPLIQLWAGICLLFLYESLLTKSPISSFQNKNKELFENFLGKYQSYFSEDQLRKGYAVIDDKWDVFHKSIRNMAILSFLFSTFLLAYMGVEPLEGNHYQCLEIMDYIVIAYLCIAGVFHTMNWFKNSISPILCFIIQLCLFHCFHSINNYILSYGWEIGYFYSRSEVTILTLFACSTGLLVILCRIACFYLYALYTQWRLRKIAQAADELNNLLLGNTQLKNAPKSIKKKVANEIIKADCECTPEHIKTFLTQEISKQFDRFVDSWYHRIINSMKHTR